MPEETSLNRVLVPDVFRLFVYGTLKPGFENHERLLKRAITTIPASCPGMLFDTPWKHPVARLSKDLILAYGQTDIGADRALQNHFQERGILPCQSWVPQALEGTIHGDILLLDEPGRDLPQLDQFEEYVPGASSSRFMRVLTWVSLDDQWVTAWMYVGGSIFESQTFRELKTGIWPEPYPS